MPTYVIENIQSPWDAETNSSQKSAYHLQGISEAIDRCM